MSFILDALKKSETDRQQNSGAEFASVPTSPRAANVPRWLWIVGVLLTVNIVILIGLLVRSDAPPVTSSTAGNASPTSAVATPRIAPLPVQDSFERQVAAAVQNPPEQQEQNPAREIEQPESGTVRPVLISQNPSAVPARDLYPTLQEVRVNGSTNLPELHLDIHVYSSNPEDRFVFINMSKLREGSQLSEGPVVEEITLDGVVLGHLGQLFLLPRDQ
jgi:general secretion pathway protein B